MEDIKQNILKMAPANNIGQSVIDDAILYADMITHRPSAVQFRDGIIVFEWNKPLESDVDYRETWIEGNGLAWERNLVAGHLSWGYNYVHLRENQQ